MDKKDVFLGLGGNQTTVLQRCSKVCLRHVVDTEHGVVVDNTMLYVDYCFQNFNSNFTENTLLKY